jgi:putative inorganic carbon (HCO3(-)) transporter
VRHLCSGIIPTKGWPNCRGAMERSGISPSAIRRRMTIFFMGMYSSMNTRHDILPASGSASEKPEADGAPIGAAHTPTGNGRILPILTPFWQDRCFEIGLILSMFLYYSVGNPEQRILYFASISPLLNQLIAVPFLLIFAVLCWYRLSIAIALLPLTLPFYLQQRAVVGTLSFSLAEVTLAVYLLIAAVHLLLENRDQLSWRQLRERLGPFFWPMLVFCGAAALSILVAYSRRFAIRAFHEEVAAPLLYLGLALLYLRSRQDLTRLLIALVGTGLLIALIGWGQFALFWGAMAKISGGQRLYAVYGSANSIGLLFDYVLPLAIACLLARVATKSRLLALGTCLLMVPVLILTFSGGAWMALSVATLFVVALSLRNRRLLLIGSALFILVVVGGLLVFHAKVEHFLLNWHAAAPGDAGSIVKRFLLWESAWHMIQNSPWLGYGMDNWLCHYSVNNVCPNTLYHYWIIVANGQPTGLAKEFDLSHPHNIFLHVWVSMGIFGLLAFSAVLVLFFRLFVRILKQLSDANDESREQLRWMTIGVGAGMLAAVVQGMIDSAFLEQDLAFCFWMLVAALLLLRIQAGVSWKDTIASAKEQETAPAGE